MPQRKCPECGEDALLYVQRSVEFHSFRGKGKNLELVAVEDSFADEAFRPFIKCMKCNAEFNMNLRKLGAPRKRDSIEIPLSLLKEDWVELVHALPTKIEYVEGLTNLGPKQTKAWLKHLNELYSKVQKIVEDHGVEC